MQQSPRYNFRYPELTDQVSAFPPDVAAQNALLLDQVIGSLTDTTTEALAGKAPSSHTHSMGQVTGLDTALAGKAPSSHTHSMGQVTGLDTALAGKAPSSHTHSMGQVTGLDAALAGKADKTTMDTRVPSALALRVDNSVGTRIFAGTTQIYGSTGWRKVDLYPAALAASNTGFVRIMRENNTLYIDFSDVTLAPGTGAFDLWFLPGGFRPSIRKLSSDIIEAVEYNIVNHIVVSNTGAMIWAGKYDIRNPGTSFSTTRSSGAIRGGISLYIDTPWPTTLPGTPV